MTRTTKYFIGRVTLFFDNYLTEYRITIKFLHTFLDHEVVHTPCILTLPQKILLLYI